MTFYNQRFGPYALQPYSPTLVPPMMQPPIKPPSMVLPEPPPTPVGKPMNPGIMSPNRDVQGVGAYGPDLRDRLMGQARAGFTKDWRGMLDALGNARIAMGPGGMLASALTGGPQPVRGYQKYDDDLIGQIRSGSIKTLGDLNKQQGDRDARRADAEREARAERGRNMRGV